MCTSSKTVVALMQAIKPTLQAILTFTGMTDTPAGQAVLTAYDAALAAVQNWKNGTSAEIVLELMNDFLTAFNAITWPGLPQNVQLLINIILGGVEAVIGILTANSPAPASAVAGDATAAEVQAQWQAHVIADTTAKVHQLVPTFKRSIWHSPAGQYKATWNEALKLGGFPETMKVA